MTFREYLEEEKKLDEAMDPNEQKIKASTKEILMKMTKLQGMLHKMTKNNPKLNREVTDLGSLASKYVSGVKVIGLKVKEGMK